jgi:cysteine synthase A
MVRVTEALAARHGWFMTQQFENQANPAYHANTTGPEILQDFANRRLDYFVSGYGTGGTITGAGRMIRLARPEVAIVSTEPAGAALLGGNPWQPHKIQGWTPDFIPAVLDREVAHQNIPVTDEEAITTSRALAVNEGIFCGISAGGTFAAALKVAAKAEPGSVILAMLPDTGERYLSTPLFEGIPDGPDEAQELLEGLG